MARRGSITSDRNGVSGTTQSIVATFPAGSVAGDVAVIAVTLNTGAGTIDTATAGANDWLTGATVVGPTYSGASMGSYLFIKKLDATDITAGAVTFHWTASGRPACSGNVFSGGAGTWQTPVVVNPGVANPITGASTTTVHTNSDVAVASTTWLNPGSYGQTTFGTGFTTDSNTGSANASGANMGSGSGHLTTPVSSGTAVGGGSVSGGTASRIIEYIVELDPAVGSPPSAPTGLTATGGKGEVDLAWSASSGATSYKVYRGGVLQGTTLETSWVDTTGTVGTSYSYTVTAVNASGESSPSSSASGTSSALPAVSTSAATFQSALASVATTAVRIAALGDSIAEGQGATTSIANRWLDKFVTNLRTTYQPSGVAGGVGFRPGKFTSTSLPAPATLAGSPSQDFTLGPGGRSVVLNGSGKSITWTVSGTSVDLVYATGPGAGTFSVSIDGGAATNINTNVGTGVVDSVTHRFTFGSRGSHTVVASYVSGSSYVEGVIVYDQDESAGVRGYDASHLGWSSNDYMSNLEKATQHPITNLMTTVDPQLVIVDLATNDWLHGESLANLRTNLNALMTLLGSTRSVVFLPAYKCDRSLESSTMVADWSQYVGVFYAVANSHSNVTIVDLSRLMPDVVGDVLGYYFDQYHPNNTGHAQIATLLGDALVPSGSNVTGTVDMSLSGASITVTGKRVVKGTVSVSTGGATISATGKRSVHGSASVTPGALSVAATGKRRVHGSGAVTVGAVSVSAAGKRRVRGVATLGLSGLSTGATGLRTVHGTSTLSLGGVSISASQGAGHITGTVSMALGGVSISATGKRRVRGTSSVAIGGASLSATGRRKVVGSAAVPIGAVVLAAVGHRATYASAVLDLADLTITAIGSSFAPSAPSPRRTTVVPPHARSSSIPANNRTSVPPGPRREVLQ